ncbi:MAG: polyketide synthase dehydratase domain-containing protein, partial [Deltaproteobacteria bacterium]|nr:polyketide synthase dehydratase domain-containing protein [Deltaproteobacteria bacterium]
GAGHRLTVHCRELDNGGGVALGLELRGQDGTLHFSAIADLDARPPPAAQAGAPLLGLGDWQGEIYDGSVLFHGAGFRVIRSVEGVSDQGIVGRVAGTREAGWDGRGWLTDPALLDGGLQLALLWHKHMMGGPSLPTSLGSYRVYPIARQHGPVRCVVQGRVLDRSAALANIVFANDDGQVVAELSDVETHLIPGGVQ